MRGHDSIGGIALFAVVLALSAMATWSLVHPRLSPTVATSSRTRSSP